MTKRSAGRKARKAEFAAERAARRANRPLVAHRFGDPPTPEITEMLDREYERSRLNVKPIVELRRLSKGGVVDGGYSMKKADLVEALLDAGVRG